MNDLRKRQEEKYNQYSEYSEETSLVEGLVYLFSDIQDRFEIMEKIGKKINLHASRCVIDGNSFLRSLIVKENVGRSFSYYVINRHKNEWSLYRLINEKLLEGTGFFPAWNKNWNSPEQDFILELLGRNEDLYFVKKTAFDLLKNTMKITRDLPFDESPYFFAHYDSKAGFWQVESTAFGINHIEEHTVIINHVNSIISEFLREFKNGSVIQVSKEELYGK